MKFTHLKELRISLPPVAAARPSFVLWWAGTLREDGFTVDPLTEWVCDVIEDGEFTRRFQAATPEAALAGASKS